MAKTFQSIKRQETIDTIRRDFRRHRSLTDPAAIRHEIDHATMLLTYMKQFENIEVDGHYVFQVHRPVRPISVPQLIEKQKQRMELRQQNFQKLLLEQQQREQQLEQQLEQQEQEQEQQEHLRDVKRPPLTQEEAERQDREQRKIELRQMIDQQFQEREEFRKIKLQTREFVQRMKKEQLRTKPTLIPGKSPLALLASSNTKDNDNDNDNNSQESGGSK